MAYEGQKRYFKTEKGKAALKRARDKFLSTEEGRAKAKAAQQKYRQSEKGKAAVARANKKFFLKHRLPTEREKFNARIDEIQYQQWLKTHCPKCKLTLKPVVDSLVWCSCPKEEVN